MSPTEALPLLIVTLLLLSVGGADVQQMAVTFDGDRTVEEIDDVLVVAGGTSTVPSDTTLEGDLYVIGGDATVTGTLEGDVTVLAGNFTVADGGTVTGLLRSIAGETDVAAGATVGAVSRFEAPVAGDSPAQRAWSLLLQFAVLGLAGAWLARRHRGALDNVGHAVTEHPLVSGTIGALAGLTMLVLFVYMAFTVVLIPVTILGLLGELLIVVYGQITFGYLLGRRLPLGPAGATVAGIGLFLVGMELLARVPYVGSAVQIGLLVVGFGAVLNTYFGLTRFEPATIPGGERG